MDQQKSVLIHLSKIVESIETDIMIPLRAHESEDRGGFLGISRNVFCYIDYLGALAANGKQLTKSAVDYMEKYFAQANSDYSSKCNLLYEMWRHGTVHEYDAKFFESKKNNFKLKWASNNTSQPHNRKWHLKCLCSAEKPDCYYLVINLFELVEDLKKSVKYFA